MKPCAIHNVETPNGNKLKVHQWEIITPSKDTVTTAAASAMPSDNESCRNLTIVTVHPWAALGGGEHNCVGVAQALVSRAARTAAPDASSYNCNCKLRVLTFNLHSSSFFGGMYTNHKKEVQQITRICNWAHEKFSSDIVLLGSSAGAPQAGSALDTSRYIVGLVCVGYTFGWLASIAFGRHFASVLRSDKPKLFIMGEKDEFTSPKQLRNMMNRAKQHRQGEEGGGGGSRDCIIVPNCGHFELESPAYDDYVAQCVIDWINEKYPH